MIRFPSQAIKSTHSVKALSTSTKIPKETRNFTTLHFFFNQRKYLVMESRLQEQIFTYPNMYTYTKTRTNTHTGERGISRMKMPAVTFL